MKWIKIAIGMFDDEKIRIIESMPDGDTIIVVWLKLLCLAGKTNNGGVFKINEQKILKNSDFSAIFLKKISKIQKSFDVLEELGMIKRIDDCVTIPNWEKWQNTEALERERKRQQVKAKAYREKQKKEVLEGVNTTDSTEARTEGVPDPYHGTQEVRTEKIPQQKKKEEEEVEIDIYNPPKSPLAGEDLGGRPTKFEVTMYCSEHGIDIDLDDFLAYGDEKGWRDWRKQLARWKPSKTDANLALLEKQLHEYDALVGSSDCPEGICEMPFSEAVLNKLVEWLRYKGEQSFQYKPIGLKSLRTKIEQEVKVHGEQAVIEAIDTSMANGWKGIIWDRLERKNTHVMKPRGIERDNDIDEDVRKRILTAL